MSGTLPTIVSGVTRLTLAYDASSWNPSTNPTATSLVLNATGSVGNLTWTGATNSVWDIRGTANWNSNAPFSPNLFFQADNVTFDDTGANKSISLGEVVSPSSMTFNNSTGAYSFSGGGSIAGPGGLVKNGTAALTLGTSNAFLGAVTLNAGQLNINNNSALGFGNSLVINGGSLGNTSGSPVVVANNPAQTWATDITFNGTSDLNLGTGAVSSTAASSTRTFNITANTLTIGGKITENTPNTGITKTGTGTLALLGNSTFAGPAQISAGTVRIGTSASLGGAMVINTTPAGNQLTLPSSTGLSLGIGVSGTGIPAGTIITAIDTTTSPPNAIVTLSATATTATATDITFATNTTPITVASGAALDVGGSATANSIVIGPRAVTISGTGVGSTGALTNSSTVTQQNVLQNVTLATNSSVGGAGRLDIRGGTPTLNLAGFTLTKVGAGQFSIVGATVSAGNIAVSAGTLSIETAASVPNDGTDNISVASGAILQFFANTGTVARPISVTGGTIRDGSGAAVNTTIASNISLPGNLILDDANATANLTLTGTITESGGSRTLTKTGPGIITLASTSNAFSGAVNLNGGLLNFAALGSLGTGPALTFNGGGLQYAAGMASPPDLSARTITLTGSGTIDTNGNNVTFANAIGAAGAGGFIKAGDGILTLNGVNTYKGTTTVAKGTLVLGVAGAFPTGTGTSGGLTMGGTDLSGAITSGTLDLAGQSITVSALTSGGTDTSSQIGSSSTTQNVTLTFAGSATGSSVYNGSIVDSVNGGSKILALTVSSGTLVLNNGSNSYSGATTINSGATLQLGNSATVNPSLNSASAITDNGSLVFGGGSIIFSNTIPGSGSVTQTGTGTLTTLSAANTYTGGTKLQGGFLQINSDTGINNGVGGIQFSGGALQFGGYTSNLSFTGANTTGNVSLASSGTSTLNGSINTTGNFTYSGSGTLTLAGTVNYTGSTNILGPGILILGAAASLPNNTSLTIGDASGSPTLDLNGHNITVSSLTSGATSTPTIINNSTTTNTTINLNGGATANTFNGNIQDGNNGKTVGLSVNSGSLTLTSGNSYSGNTSIGPGATLSLSNGTVNGSIPNTARLTLNGGTFATGGQGLDMHTTKLNLTASSVIDLGNNSGTVQLADSTDQAWNASAYLRINNWTNDLTGGGQDQIKFTGSGLTSSQLSKVHFTGYMTGAAILPISDPNAGELVPLTALKIGDVNQDGSVSIADVSALMNALVDPTTYLANHPALVDSLTVTDLLDVNGDGKDTNADLQALISKIATNGGNPSLTAVPEPTGLVLLAIGGVCGLAVRRRRKVFAV